MGFFWQGYHERNDCRITVFQYIFFLFVKLGGSNFKRVGNRHAFLLGRDRRSGEAGDRTCDSTTELSYVGVTGYNTMQTCTLDINPSIVSLKSQNWVDINHSSIFLCVACGVRQRCLGWRCRWMLSTLTDDRIA
jgi:hypothetical protein